MTTMKKSFIAPLVLFFCASCGEVAKEPVPVSSVTVSPTSLSMTEGDTETLKVTVLPENADDKTVVWESSNSTVATVSNGVVKALAGGTSTITAKAGGKSATCAVTVTPAFVSVSSIAFSGDSFSMRDDEELTLVVSFTPENASNKNLSWSSSNESVATVSAGVVHGKAVGETTITATSEDGNKTATCKVQVTSSLISFADKYVKMICVSKYDTNGDGELSYKEAAVPTRIPTNFFGDDYKSVIKSFDEFQYFTSVGTIERWAFSGTSMESIIFPPSIAVIDEGAFSSQHLKTIKLNEGLKVIGEYAFQGCPLLEELALPSTLETIHRGAFQATESLKTLTIPSGITELSEGLLAGSAIESISLPSTLKKISDYVFGVCPNLKELTIPSSVSEIGNAIAYGCESLKQIHSSYSIDNGRGIVVAGVLKAFAPYGLTEYSIPETVSAIGERVFCKLTTLKELTVPSEVVSIGKQSFAWNTGIRVLNIKGSNPPSVGVEAFADNNLEKIVLEAIYVPATSVDAYKAASGWSAFSAIIKPEGAKNAPEAVDMGYGLKWAAWDLGASSPYEYGARYAWGETETKDSYSWENYKYCMGDQYKLTKYCGSAYYGNDGFTDGKSVLEPEDDAAHVNLGGKWRMPTYEEISMLENSSYFKQEWVVENGVGGIRVTSLANGNSIFFMHPSGSEFRRYHSAALYTYHSYNTDPRFTYCICLLHDRFTSNTAAREAGNYIRPVCDE